MQEVVQDRDTPAAVLLHLGERVRLAAVVLRDERFALIAVELTGPERPTLRAAIRLHAVRLQLGHEALERRLAVPDTRARPDRRVERRRVTVVLDIHSLLVVPDRSCGPGQHGEHGNNNDPDSDAIHCSPSNFGRRPTLMRWA